jgi:hypothetical protein
MHFTSQQLSMSIREARTYGGLRGFPILGHGTLMMFRAVKF